MRVVELRKWLALLAGSAAVFAFQNLILDLSILSASIFTGMMLVWLYIFLSKGFCAPTIAIINGIFSSILSHASVFIFHPLIKADLGFSTLYMSFLFSAAVSMAAIGFQGRRNREIIVIGRKDEFEGYFKGFQVNAYINPSPVRLKKLIETHPDSSIVVADAEMARAVKDVLLTRNVTYLPRLVERNFHKIPISVLRMYKEYYLVEFSRTSPTMGKRVFDILTSVILLVILAPLAIYKYFSGQKEVTEFVGENMKVLKLPRRKGLIRLFAIAVMILRGDFSLVGIGKIPVDEFRELCKTVPELSMIFKAKPGLIDVGRVLEKNKNRRYEVYLWYAKNQSLMVDLWVLFKTIFRF